MERVGWRYNHISIVVAASLFLFVLILVAQRIRHIIRKKLYRPVRKHITVHKQSYRDIYLNTENGEHTEAKTKSRVPVSVREKETFINLWYLNNYKGARIILYFHGNSYNISYRKYMMDICDHLKVNLLLVDYRGYGRSKGEPSPRNVLADAISSYKFLLKMGHKPLDVVVWGESLGGSAGCCVASQCEVHSLILLSPFSSLHSMLRDSGNVVRNSAYSAMRLITTDFQQYTNNAEMIRTVRCPVLIFHSCEDKLIPHSNAVELIAAVPNINGGDSKQLVTIKGDHDSPQIGIHEFSYVLRLLGLKISKWRKKEIVRIIRDLSFTAETSSLSTHSDDKNYSAPDINTDKTSVSQ